MGLLDSRRAEVKGDLARFSPAAGERVDLLSLPENEMRRLRGTSLTMVFRSR
jgi:ABC-type microcin C transport system duplicated ATPase subunit YejF